MTTPDPISDLLERGSPPPAPPGLRARALERAHSAAVAGEPSAAGDLWDRAWQSGGLRLAWVAAVAALVFGHVWVAERARIEAIEPSYGGLVRSALAADPELDELVGLVPLRLVPVPLLGTAAGPAVPNASDSENHRLLENS